SPPRLLEPGPDGVVLARLHVTPVVAHRAARDHCLRGRPPPSGEGSPSAAAPFSAASSASTRPTASTFPTCAGRGLSTSQKAGGRGTPGPGPGPAGLPPKTPYAVFAPPDRRSVFLGDKRAPGSPEPRIYEVQLTTTPCHFGGWRWWFSCPLVVRGVPCNRRCR